MSSRCIQYTYGCVNYDENSVDDAEKPCVMMFGLPLQCGFKKNDVKLARLRSLNFVKAVEPLTVVKHTDVLKLTVKSLCGESFKNGGAKASHERFCPICITAKVKERKATNKLCEVK